MKAMVLAAGLGTRMRPYTERYAKPAIPFLNIPLLYYPIALLEQLNLSDLVVNTHHLPEQIENLTRSMPGRTYEAHFSPEPDQILGPGGGIWKAKHHFVKEKNFLVANGDEVIFPSSSRVMPQLLAAHEAHDALATILVMRDPRVGSQFGGVWTDSNAKVYGFGKSPNSLPGAEHAKLTGFHYIGIQVLSSRVFKYLPDGPSNILYDALTSAIAAGERVQIFEDQCTWFETGNPKDFLEATSRCLQEQVLPHSNPFLSSMFKRFWPEFSQRPTLLLGRGSSIPSNYSKNQTSILTGNNSIIHDGAQLRGCLVLGDTVTVHSDAVLEDSVVLSGASVRGHHSHNILMP